MLRVIWPHSDSEVPCIYNIIHPCVILPSHVVFFCVSAHVLDLTLEIFNKCCLRQRILPLASQREFSMLYNENYPPDLVPASRRSNTFNLRRSIKAKNTQRRRWKSGSSKRAPLVSPDGAGERKPRSTTSVLSKKGRAQMEIRSSRQTLHSGSKTKSDAAE